MVRKAFIFPVALLLVISFMLILLAESKSSQVRSVSESYQFVAKWGSSGTGDGQFIYTQQE